jgi:hypothetical protein
MGHLYWAAFPKKIISRKDAEAAKGGLCINFRYLPPYFPTIVNVGANKHSPKLRCRAKPTVGYFYTPPQGGASSMPDYPDILGITPVRTLPHFPSRRRCCRASLGECLFAPTPGIGGVDREDCLNQDFQDFRIFRIMGDDGLEMGGTKNGAPTHQH